MAHRAVLKTGRAQIVEGGWHDTEDRIGSRGVGKIGVALQADEPHFLPDQHPRIGGAVGLMTSSTTLESHHGVLKGKGAALVGVAVEASGFVSTERLQHRSPDAAVRIMAIHAAHGVLGYFVVKRSLKLRPHIQMAANAKLVYRRSFSNHQAVGSVGVDLVARRAGDLILGVAAL